MERRGYQLAFSAHSRAMHDPRGRERKARTMVAVLRDFLGAPLEMLDVLNAGASTGIIDNFLAAHFRSVVGVDIDAAAIRQARRSHDRPNLSFLVGDAMALAFPADCFDVVICSQVYEHVPDARRLMEEIFRVLKPGGVCYFAAGNRIMWKEPHYGLPLLSLLPRPLAHACVRAAGKGDRYHELHFTLFGLRRLVQRFRIHDYTRHIVHRPGDFAAGYMLAPRSFKLWAARMVADYAYWLMPGYVWILEKPAS